jgi:hypothetical protein
VVRPAREAQSLIEHGRSGGEAIGTVAALAANPHRESQGKTLPAAAISQAPSLVAAYLPIESQETRWMRL